MTLEHIVTVWSKAQTLQPGPTWRGEPESTALMERIAEEWQVWREQIIGLLDHPIGLVAAHALYCLHQTSDLKLLSLDADILESTKGVTVQDGSFRMTSNLGSLARKWAKQFKAKNKKQSP